MRIVTGDECGLLKECIPELSRKEEDPNAPVSPFGAMPDVTREGVSRIDPKEIQSRSRGVIDLAYAGGDDSQLSFAALRQNGSVEFWEGDTSSKRSFGNYDRIVSTNDIFSDVEYDTKLRPLGLGFFQKQKLACVGDMLGNLAVVNIKNGKVVERFNAYSKNKGRKTISYTPGNSINRQLATAMACDPINGRVAIGGRERETTLLDLSTGNVVFKAKNLPPDPQTLLQQPVWPTSILFLEGSSTMAVGTGYKQVRLYDVRENSKMRRPTKTTPEGLLEYRVTSLCQINENRLVVGDAAGFIYDLDMRTFDRNLKRTENNNVARYAGPAGSVRQLKKHPTLPRLAAVGLDRMLRVYDTNKRKQLDCVYLKQRLNCVLFGSDETWEIGEPNSDIVGDYDIDQDDVVEDYVDSDDEQAEKQNSDESGDQMEGSDNTSDEEDEQDEVSGDSDSGFESIEESASKDESDSEEMSRASENEDDSEVDGSEDDEVIDISAKRRRRT